MVGIGLQPSSKSRKRLLQVAAGEAKFATMEAPQPEDTQVPAVPDAQALQEVMMVQAQDPVKVNILLYFVALLVSAGYPSLFTLFPFRT